MWDLGYGAGSHLRHQWKVCVWKNTNYTDTDANSGVTSESLQNQEKMVWAGTVLGVKD